MQRPYKLDYEGPVTNPEPVPEPRWVIQMAWGILALTGFVVLLVPVEHL